MQGKCIFCKLGTGYEPDYHLWTIIIAPTETELGVAVNLTDARKSTNPDLNVSAGTQVSDRFICDKDSCLVPGYFRSVTLSDVEAAIRRGRDFGTATEDYLGWALNKAVAYKEDFNDAQAYNIIEKYENDQNA